MLDAISKIQPVFSGSPGEFGLKQRHRSPQPLSGTQIIVMKCHKN